MGNDAGSFALDDAVSTDGANSPVYRPASGAALDVFQPVDVDEVSRSIASLQVNSAELTRYRPDCSRTAALNWRRTFAVCVTRHCVQVMCHSSSHITLLSPLVKKANLDSSDVKNYRPISNLSVISKLLERVILRGLLEHHKRNDMLPSVQSDYRKCH